MRYGHRRDKTQKPPPCGSGLGSDANFGLAGLRSRRLRAARTVHRMNHAAFLRGRGRSGDWLFFFHHGGAGGGEEHGSERKRADNKVGSHDTGSSHPFLPLRASKSSGVKIVRQKWSLAPNQKPGDKTRAQCGEESFPWIVADVFLAVFTQRAGASAGLVVSDSRLRFYLLRHRSAFRF